MKMPVAPAPPAVPAVPAPAAPPKAAGFWPLIVVLTVLFAIAAMLVMYFALKH
jgi:predicted tellurium resistance membrane protein TerC